MEIVSKISQKLVKLGASNFFQLIEDDELLPFEYFEIFLYYTLQS